MKQKGRSFSCSYILIPLLFTLYTSGIHHLIFIKYSHINSYICHLDIIILLYHSISSLSKIIIKHNHYIIIKQNHHIIFKQNHQNHYIIFKKNLDIIIIKKKSSKSSYYHHHKLQSYHRNIHITIGDHQNHN